MTDGKHIIRLAANVNAPIEVLFDFMCDHEQFGRIWTGKTTRVKDSEEADNVNGIGSIRQIALGPIPGLMKFREIVTVCKRPTYIEYRIIGLAPIKNHVGKIRFVAKGDVTQIDYTIAFDPHIPGTAKLVASSIERDWARNFPSIARELERQAA